VGKKAILFDTNELQQKFQLSCLVDRGGHGRHGPQQKLVQPQGQYLAQAKIGPLVVEDVLFERVEIVESAWMSVGECRVLLIATGSTGDTGDVLQTLHTTAAQTHQAMILRECIVNSSL
jgi:hypothetical protein